ncbi:MAG: hypothetical protein LBU89_03365 [Fibromonadaceae bacterium]|jgi:hypothetical protein|nr:hypothetical protein [Fibromonadaceae bacterium]
MRQIRDMSIIEIDITNSCHKSCSNCTRFCGHHKKKYFMSFEMFKQAMDSLDGYEGSISLIGGEPLLHPEINRFLEYMQTIKEQKGIKDLSKEFRCQALSKDYFECTRIKRWFELAYNRGLVYTLFTSIPDNYYKSYENLQDVISNLWLNDHSKPSFHQPILANYKDLGIEQVEFEKLRDNCWLQNCWSASITSKGTFFCEVAGTMDMLFNGPGGHPIEPGWWNKDLNEWKNQLHWCDLCGMPLKTFSRNANDGIDDVTPLLYEKLKNIDSKKIKLGKVKIFSELNLKENENSISGDMYDRKGLYLSSVADRLVDAKEKIKPKKIFEFRVNENSFGQILPEAIKKCDERDWVLLVEHNAEMPDSFVETIKEFYLNPGYLFVCDFRKGKAALFSPIAKSAKRIDFDEMHSLNCVDDLKNKWEKILVLDSDFANISDMDIPYLKQNIFEDYSKDDCFKKKLQIHFDSLGVIKEKANILLLQIGTPFHTLGIYKILKDFNCHVHLLSSKTTSEFFSEFSANDVTFFDEERYNYDSLLEIRQNLKKLLKWDGFIMPYARSGSSIKPVDNYTDCLKTAQNIADKSLGIINIKRQLVEPDYDIWR